MSRFPKTEQALSEVFANQQILYGVHGSEELRTRGIGVNVGERPFRPERDSVADINPLSVGEAIFGEPHVPLIIPERPIAVNVVTQERHQPSTDKLGIIPAKRRLAADLSDALSDALPGITDRVFQYAVGEAAETAKSVDVEVIGTDGNPLTDAKTIAEICQEGLTFVVSDFLDLPLEKEAADDEFPMTIAVKANHHFDLALPEDVGRLRTGIRGGEINTRDPEELAEVNAEMAKAHARTVNRLRNAGIAVAHIIMDPSQRTGFDAQRADQALSGAIDTKNPDKA